MAKEATVTTTTGRLLDVAEELFAVQGFAATSLGDVAERASLRGPAIFKYFKNKQHLYEEVLSRLLDPLLRRLTQLSTRAAAGSPIDNSEIEALFQYHIDNPNAARLVQRAALARGEQLELIAERWMRPIVTHGLQCWSAANGARLRDDDEATVVYIACTNLLISLVTLGPLHEILFGKDSVTPRDAKAQLQLIKQLALSV